jgi:hypothetical protein
VLSHPTIAPNFSRFCFRFALALASLLILDMTATLNVYAQTAGLGPAEIETSVKPEQLPIAPVAKIALPSASTEHKFWDPENRALFASVAALSAADFAVTRSNLQSGGQELNPVTRMFGRSTAGLAANFAGETAGSIGISYLFHKTGHHRLERVTSMVNISGSAAAVAYGLRHR